MLTYIRFGLALLNILDRILDSVEKSKYLKEGERIMVQKIRKRNQQSIKDISKLRDAIGASTEKERHDILKS